VTDRRALDLGRVPSAGKPGSKNISTVAARALLEKIRNVAAAGIDWIQIREKNLETRALADLLRLAVAASRGTRTKILVNDRLEQSIDEGFVVRRIARYIHYSLDRVTTAQFLSSLEADCPFANPTCVVRNAPNQ